MSLTESHDGGTVVRRREFGVVDVFVRQGALKLDRASAQVFNTRSFLEVSRPNPSENYGHNHQKQILL
jgi:hypothetical protein